MHFKGLEKLLNAIALGFLAHPPAVFLDLEYALYSGEHGTPSSLW